jgi:hypothetical protein
MRGVISQHHPGGHQKSYLQLHTPKIFKTKFKFNSYTTYQRKDGNSML